MEHFLIFLSRAVYLFIGDKYHPEHRCSCSAARATISRVQPSLELTLHLPAQAHFLFLQEMSQIAISITSLYFTRLRPSLVCCQLKHRTSPSQRCINSTYLIVCCNTTFCTSFILRSRFREVTFTANPTPHHPRQSAALRDITYTDLLTSIHRRHPPGAAGLEIVCTITYIQCQRYQTSSLSGKTNLYNRDATT